MRFDLGSIGVLAALGFCVITARAQTPGILAEGIYNDEDKNSPISPTPIVPVWHWKMTSHADGSFTVEDAPITVNENVKLVEVFGFSKEWKPASYALKTYLGDSTQNSVSIVCKYQQDAISCDWFEHGKKRSSGSLHIHGPKVFFPDSEDADIFWSTAAACIQAERTPGKVTTVSVVTIDPSNPPFKLVVAGSFAVTYMGQGDLKIGLGTIRAHKFRIDDSTVWTADSGLVLAMEGDECSGCEGRTELISLDDPTHRLLPALAQR